VNYIVNGEAGETLLAQLEGEGVLMTVLAPNGNPPDRRASRVLGWTGTLEATGEYTIQLRPVQGVPQSDYALEVSLSAGADPEAPTDPTEPETPPEPEAPDPPEEPEEPEPPDEPEIISEQRIRFPQGQNSILVANSAGPSRIRRYVVNLQAGQVLQVAVDSSTAPTTFTVRLPAGTPLASSVQLWEDAAPVNGDYAIDVAASSDSEFTLRFEKR
jgi:serine/threonine-protein kinase